MSTPNQMNAYTRLCKLRTFVVLASIFLGANVVDASYTLSFTPDNTSTSFTVPEAGSVDLPVYLIATGTPVLNGDLDIDGIYSAGVRLDFDSGGTSATFVAVTPNPSFADLIATESGAGFAQFQSGITVGSSTVSGSPIFLGNFTFMGNTSGDVTTVAINEPSFSVTASTNDFIGGGSAGALFEQFPVLDTQIFSTSRLSTTITTTAIPEPSAFLFACLVGCIFICRGYRKNRP